MSQPEPPNHGTHVYSFSCVLEHFLQFLPQPPIHPFVPLIQPWDQGPDVVGCSAEQENLHSGFGYNLQVAALDRGPVEVGVDSRMEGHLLDCSRPVVERWEG